MKTILQIYVKIFQLNFTFKKKRKCFFGIGRERVTIFTNDNVYTYNGLPQLKKN